MNKAKVAIVILNYNGRGYLLRFLPSFLKYAQGHRIIVADNASTDDSVEVLRLHFPEVERLIIPENLGFAGGYNYALNQIDAEYYAIVNSDIEVSESWLNPLIDTLDNNPQIAAVQPKIKSHKEPHKFEYAGAAGGMIDTLGYPFCRGRLFHHTEEDIGQFDDEKEIFWCSGACMLVRAALFHQIGGFDEYFFAHMEEIDLCWRLQHSGYRLSYNGKAQVFHVGGGTLAHGNPRKTYLNFRNGLSLLYKNLPQNQVNKLLIQRLLLDGLAAVKFLILDLSPKDVRAVWKAHRDFFKSRKRYTKGVVNSKSTWPKMRGVYKGSIVWQVFFKGRKKTSAFLED